MEADQFKNIIAADLPPQKVIQCYISTKVGSLTYHWYTIRGQVILTSMSFRNHDSTDLGNARLFYEKYLPLAKMLYRAGWEPETGVTGFAGVYCEPYGNPSKGNAFLVVYNESDTTKDVRLTFGRTVFRNHPSQAVNILGQKKTYHIFKDSILVVLRPDEERVLEVGK